MRQDEKGGDLGTISKTGERSGAIPDRRIVRVRVFTNRNMSY